MSALLFLVAAALQDEPPEAVVKDLREAAPLFARFASLDPGLRDAARDELARRFKDRKETLRASAESAPEAWIVLAVLGDASARQPLLKLLDGDALRLAAVEAYGLLEPRGAPREIMKLLESDDSALAFAAARAAARAKSPSVHRELQKAAQKHHAAGDKEKMIVAIYGVQLIQPDHDLTQIFLYLESADAAVFHRAVIAALNLPPALERLRVDFDDKTQRRCSKLRDRFDKDDLDPETRGLLGMLLFRASAIAYSDILGFLKSAVKGLPEWAESVAFREDVWKRCVLIEELCRQMEAAGDTKKLEDMFEQATKFRPTEEKREDRVKACRAWWERNRLSTTDQDVPKTIDTGVAFLRKIQRPDGAWAFCSCGHPAYAKVDHALGATALTVYTLLKCDVPVDDAAVVAGLKVLLEADIAKANHTYTISLVAIALSEALEARKPKKDRKTVAQDKVFAPAALKKIAECADWLIEAQVRIKKGGYEQGAWTYNKAPGGEGWDQSNTQFAILGLLAARNAGVRIPPEVWQRALLHWQAQQLDDGGWMYGRPADPPPPDVKYAGSNSMTAAGICSYLVAKAAIRNIGTKAAALQDKAIDAAIGKFTKQYPIGAPVRNPQFGHVFSVYYDLYSLERAMMLGGFETLGGKDWYHDGALYILYNQLHDGSWLDLTDTCFALLFLKKAYIAVASGEEK